MSSDSNTYPTLPERLADGDMLALLDGIEWDAREDITIPGYGTLISAVAGATHVKALVTQDQHDGTPFAQIEAAVHESPDATMVCHGGLCSQARAMALVAETRAVMADAVTSVRRSPEPGGYYV